MKKTISVPIDSKTEYLDEYRVIKHNANFGSFLDIDYCTLDEAISVCEQIRKDYGSKYSKISIRKEAYDCGCFSSCECKALVLYGTRLETDEEYSKRLEYEALYKKDIEDKERAQFEALKKKFEG